MLCSLHSFSPVTTFKVAINDEDDFRRVYLWRILSSRYIIQFIVASLCWQDNL